MLRQKLDERNNHVTDREIRAVAEATDGRVAADMEPIVNKAATRAFNDNRDAIGFNDIKQALEGTDW